MKLAVASQDGTKISRHFGRSSCFLVYNIEDDKIVGRELRNVSWPDPSATSPGHAAILQAIDGCNAILCAGIGTHASEHLRARNIEMMVTLDADLEPDEAVQRLLNGTLRAGWAHACCCKESH